MIKIRVKGQYKREKKADQLKHGLVEVMERVKQENEIVPQWIQVDNGSEFISKALDKWAYDSKVTLDFSRPGKPTDNPYFGPFNGSIRDGCLNINWFLSLRDAQEKIEGWRQEHNCFRPQAPWEI